MLALEWAGEPTALASQIYAQLHERLSAGELRRVLEELGKLQ